MTGSSYSCQSLRAFPSRTMTLMGTWTVSWSSAVRLEGSMADFATIGTWVAAALLGLVPLLFFGGFAYTRKLYSKNNGKLKVPKGNPWMLPFIGETLQLLTAGAPSDFCDSRYNKYGGMFTTNPFGSPTVMAETAEAAKYFLTSRQFELRSTPNFRRIFGKNGITQIEGEAHKRLRSLMLAIVGQQHLAKLVTPLDELARDHFNGDQDGVTIESVEALMKFSFSITSILVSGFLKPGNPEFRHAMQCMTEGWSSLDRIGLPGSAFRRALNGRQTCLRILDEVIAERSKTGGEHHDLIQVLLDTKNSDHPLSDAEMKDAVLAFVFASYHTSAVSMTWMLKYLHDHPDIRQQVMEEQDSIAARKAPGELLTAADLKETTLSTRVILETLRLASFAPFTMREAMEDVEFNGYYIPKGWKVLIDLRRPHFESETYPDPTKFDPCRFENPPKPGTFTPFGGGRWLCIGNDFAKQQLLILMHRFFTQYTYKTARPDRGTVYLPFNTPKGGYLITLSKRRRTRD